MRARINAADPQHSGAFTEEEVSTLPLGSTTFTRTFDQLTLLLPGVVPPPQTLGSVAGPGVGPGVGTSGQFSVNGLRSRGNNFTVDGSDNNDEDIGVRRQGFVALNSQPIESVKEYQAITLLAPAQFGRNIGAQVNAVSKSGGSETHGIIYGFFNSSQLNARNFFDTSNGTDEVPLRVGNQSVILGSDVNIGSDLRPVVTNARPLTVRNQSGGENSLTFAQGGFAFGGPLEPERAPGKPGRMFYFISAEGNLLNATQEESFAVPTVEQRGAFGTGATGLFFTPFERDENGNPLRVFAFPTTQGGDAIFSLFPFPNNPNGVYGANTFTQVLPAGGQGKILSGKFDGNFKIRARQQSLTGRYNFTDDFRDIPATGGAIFSTLRPRVRTQNFSFFYNSQVSGPNSTKEIFNQVRLSYGRTRLNFEETRDRTFAVPSIALPNTPFLLNTTVIGNFTLPMISGENISPNTGPIIYSTSPVPRSNRLRTAEDILGPVGQVNIAGFSPIGVDVFNFPQRRVNNTYQVADTLTIRGGNHSLTFGVDTRRSELNSELPRNSRPLITFAGAPELASDDNDNLTFTGRYIRPETFAAAAAASGFYQTLALRGESGINLRFYQLNYFGQDVWRIRPNLSLSLGLRYEYNTPAREAQQRIESTFRDPLLNFVPGLRQFIGDRTRIYEPDRDNFAPRIGIAYSPNLFGRERGVTVIRGGYGLFFDQILGAVVSQSRNVYPSYLTVNFGGGFSNLRAIPGTFGNPTDPDACPPEFERCSFQLISPSVPFLNVNNPITRIQLVQPGMLNTLNPALSFGQVVNIVNSFVRGGAIIPPVSGFGMTIPAQRLDMPMAHHYTFTVDQQLGPNMVFSASYVGTQGRKLLRFNTPNLGPNSYIVPLSFSFLPPDEIAQLGQLVPRFFGLSLPPGVRLTSQGDITGGRPVPTAGAIYRFETTASSRYDSLQLQVRGRFRRSLQYQAAYTFAKAIDDVSDVFDLAGASSLPQNSLNLAAERGLANFDARHRFSYNFVYDFPSFSNRHAAFRMLFGGFQVASIGRFQTGQPFTVNSIFDVNLDGNLTDRLNSTQGITVTGDRRQPLMLTMNDPSQLLAPIGQDGSVGRNTFRSGSILELDMAIVKRFALSERQNVIFRVDIFNVPNRTNFGIPVRFLEAPAFGQAVNTITPGRRVQFALKYSF